MNNVIICGCQEVPRQQSYHELPKSHSIVQSRVVQFQTIGYFRGSSWGIKSNCRLTCIQSPQLDGSQVPIGLSTLANNLAILEHTNTWQSWMHMPCVVLTIIKFYMLSTLQPLEVQSQFFLNSL